MGATMLFSPKNVSSYLNIIAALLKFIQRSSCGHPHDRPYQLTTQTHCSRKRINNNNYNDNNNNTGVKMSIVSRRGYPVNVVLHTRYTYTDTRTENINTRRVRFVSIERRKKKYSIVILNEE